MLIARIVLDAIVAGAIGSTLLSGVTRPANLQIQSEKSVVGRVKRELGIGADLHLEEFLRVDFKRVLRAVAIQVGHIVVPRREQVVPADFVAGAIGVEGLTDVAAHRGDTETLEFGLHDGHHPGSVVTVLHAGDGIIDWPEQTNASHDRDGENADRYHDLDKREGGTPGAGDESKRRLHAIHGGLGPKALRILDRGGDTIGADLEPADEIGFVESNKTTGLKFTGRNHELARRGGAS